MVKIPIKPFSQNRVKRGRTYKTAECRNWERDFRLLLLKYAPRDELSIPDGDLELHFQFGFSSRNADVDNPVKIAQDTLCRHFGFANDNRIRAISVRSVKVAKGAEFIAFSFCAYRDDARWEALIQRELT